MNLCHEHCVNYEHFNSWIIRKSWNDIVLAPKRAKVHCLITPVYAHALFTSACRNLPGWLPSVKSVHLPQGPPKFDPLSDHPVPSVLGAAGGISLVCCDESFLEGDRPPVFHPMQWLYLMRRGATKTRNTGGTREEAIRALTYRCIQGQEGGTLVGTLTWDTLVPDERSHYATAPFADE